MSNTVKNIIIAVVVLIVVELIRRIIGGNIYSKLMFFLSNKKQKEFDELIDSKKAKLFIPPFNRNFLKLSLAVGKNSKKEVAKCEDIFKDVVMNKKQKRALYSCFFEYYVTNNDLEGSKKYYDLLKKIMPDSGDLDITYDTYVEKGYKYLDVVLAKLDNARGNQLVGYEMHISQMYKNKGDTKNGDKYAKLAEKHLNELNKRA